MLFFHWEVSHVISIRYTKIKINREAINNPRGDHILIALKLIKKPWPPIRSSRYTS